MTEFDYTTSGALTSRAYRNKLYDKWAKMNRIPVWVRKALNNQLPPCIVGGHQR